MDSRYIMDHFGRVVIRVIFGLSACFPFAVVSITRISEMPLFSLGLLVMLLLACLSLVAWFDIASRSNEKMAVWFTVAMIVGCGSCWRLFFLMMIDPQPVSDFLGSYLCAKHDAFGTENMASYYARFPYYGFYAITIRAIMSFSGNQVWDLACVNILLNATNGIALYLIGSKCIRSNLIGLCSVTLYMFWPDLAVYSGVLTAEHFAMLFLTLTTLFWMLPSVMSKDAKKKWLRLVGYAALSGFSAGLFHGYRALMPVVVIALVLYEVMEWVRFSGQFGWANAGARLIEMIVRFMVFVLFAFVTGIGITGLVELKIDRNVESVTGNHIELIYYGLHPEGKGQYSMAVGQEIRGLYRDFGSEGANRVMKERVMSWIKNDTGRLFEVLRHKVKVNWISDLKGMFWASSYVDWYSSDSSAGFIDIDRNARPGSGWDRVQRLYGVFASSSYSLIMLLGFAGGVGLAVKWNDGLSKIGFVCLVVFGFFLLGLLIQAQARYKSVVSPFVCVMGGVGLFFLYGWIRRFCLVFNVRWGGGGAAYRECRRGKSSGSVWATMVGLFAVLMLMVFFYGNSGPNGVESEPQEDPAWYVPGAIGAVSKDAGNNYSIRINPRIGRSLYIMNKDGTPSSAGVSNGFVVREGQEKVQIGAKTYSENLRGVSIVVMGYDSEGNRLDDAGFWVRQNGSGGFWREENLGSNVRYLRVGFHLSVLDESLPARIDIRDFRVRSY